MRSGDTYEQARLKAKVRGEARYIDDIELPDMLHGAIARAPLAHANIVSIDTSKAGTREGVCAVVTSRDLADLKYLHMPRYSDRRILARDKVRFYGEEVAAVAAVDVQTACAAAAEIEVRYASLGYAESAERALKRYFPRINAPPGSALGKNLVLKFNRDFGDVDVSEARAATTIEGRYHAEACVPASLEAGGTIAHFDVAHETLQVWTTSQAPFVVRWELAEVLRLDRDQIDVKPLFIGSPPSASAYCPEHAAIAAALSMATHRPVKIVLPHNEDIISKRAECAERIDLRQSLDGEGNVSARGVSVLVDAGAYAGLAPAHLIAGRQVAAELYRVPAVRFDWQVAYSNTAAGGLYPSLGIPQMLWAIEDQMDRAAEACGMDPLDYRIRQASRAGDETPLGRQVQGSEMIACLEAVGDQIGWRDKRENYQAGRGVGVAACVWPSAGMLGAEGFVCEVSLALDASGVISLGVERVTADARQNGILARACAEALGVRESLIDLVIRDSHETARQSALAPYDETLVLVDAILDAAGAFRTTLRTALADPELRIDGDRIVSKAQGALTLAEGYAKVGPCASLGVAPRSAAQAPEAHGHLSEMHSVCAHAAEVEVEPLTGEVRVRRVVVALDIGEILWREALEGEVREGVERAIQLALGEPIRVDAGKPVHTSPASLGALRFEDAPSIEIVQVAPQSSAGPLNAKATGESAGYAGVAAIAGAIAHATGCRLDTLPFTAERIRAAMMRKARMDNTPHEAIPTYPFAQAANIRDAGLRTALNAVPARRRLMPLARPDEHRYLLAEHVDEVFDCLLRSGVATKIRAGGTDLTPGIHQGIYRPELVVDISRIPALVGVVRTHNCLRIGACTRLSALEVDAEVRDLFPVLAASVNMIASAQIRNLATVGGNLCQQKQCSYYRNAFPCRKLKGIGHPCFAVTGDHRRHSVMRTWPCAAPCPSDLAPLLDVLDAALVIGSASGERRTSMDKFYRWSGEPALAPDEMLTAIEVPLQGSPRSTVFEKHATTRGDFALASVAVSLGMWQGRVRTARISLGGVSPFPERAHLAERMLIDQAPSDQRIREAARATVRGALPMRMNKGKVPLVVQLAERAFARALGRL
ncbi:MAG: molybdopterin-dependent oxidoreductase [Gammaproteobacteria bacterium]|nr:molybdopterin-dependent oxidoreductase [Gammaproteobacteria bacterium]